MVAPFRRTISPLDIEAPAEGPNQFLRRGFAGITHNFAPTGMMAALKHLVKELPLERTSVRFSLDGVSDQPLVQAGCERGRAGIDGARILERDGSGLNDVKD